MEIVHQNMCMVNPELVVAVERTPPQKSGPIAGATVQKRQRVGKSGKAMQGADPAAGSAYCEKSRTESEGQARPLFLLWTEALAAPK